MLAGAIMAGAGIAGSLFGSDPEWQDVTFQGVNAGRYGFQGVYQKFLQSENQRLKDDEQRRIMKLASSLVPGMASFRGGLTSQGLSGATSNVMANQQRNQAMGKALDTGMQTAEQGFGRLNEMLGNQTMQNEGMYNQATQFNASGQLQVDIANSQGRMGADTAAAQNIFGQIGTAGMGMIGQEIGMKNFHDLFSKKNPLEGFPTTLSEVTSIGHNPNWNEEFEGLELPEVFSFGQARKQIDYRTGLPVGR